MLRNLHSPSQHFTRLRQSGRRQFRTALVENEALSHRSSAGFLGGEMGPRGYVSSRELGVVCNVVLHYL